MEHVPGKADAWLEILVVLGIRLAHQKQRHGCGIKRCEPVLCFRRRHVPGVAQPKFQSEIGLELPTILRKEVQRAFIKPVGNVADCSCSRVHGRSLEMRTVVKNKLPRIAIEIVVAEIAELTAKLEGMSAANVAQGIRANKCHVPASLRKSALVTEEKSEVANTDSGHEGLIRAQSGAESKRGGIGRVIGYECNVDPVASQTRFVDQVWTENMGLIEGQHLAFSFPGVAESRNGCAGSRFLAQIVLIHVIAVQVVIITEVVAEVGCALIDVHWSDRRTRERIGNGRGGADGRV